MKTIEPVEELKMWLAVRKDLNMPAGKLAVQSGHAFAALSVDVFQVNPELYAQYYNQGSMPKIVVGVDSVEDLALVNASAKASQIYSYLIKDAGRTVFNEPTYTVCAFGPAKKSQLSKFLKKLRLYGGDDDNSKQENKNSV